ncbi:MAG TPA: VanW family protein [Candidatus Elarobacter sp.]|nr:VanW family protein [Candidatus Elarobacter sp.]
MRTYRRGDIRPGDVLLAESTGPLWGGAGVNPGERGLTLGKVQNLRVAVRRIDGVVVPAQAIFSFWRHVGRATRRAGYVRGRELREGCMVPSVGGGLCQLSNALYDAALSAGFEIVERHAHTAVVPGSLAEIGRDATVFWNYVDLRFRVPHDVRIEAALTADKLSVRFWGAGVAAGGEPAGAPVARVHADTAAAPAAHATGDCATCGVEQCFRHAALRRRPVAAERTAFLLDGYWPEYDVYVASVIERDDVMVLPVDGQHFSVGNYRWDTSRAGAVRQSPLLTLLRSYRSRGVARQGAARQRLLLAWADRMAARFASQLSYDVNHLVVMQHLLPALSAGGHLGGRTYDVLMTGIPMRHVQAALDDAIARHPESPTLRDFRADPRLVDAEERALAAARAVITPHAAVAVLFGSRAVRLPWATPAAAGLVRGPATALRSRAVVFAAPTLGRAGAYELRDVARDRELHVILTGNDLESPGFWDGISVERRDSFDAALGNAACVALPAYVENQPRRLLRAAAMGLPVIASSACGLGDVANVTTVRAGDVGGLRAAIGSAYGDDLAAAAEG